QDVVQHFARRTVDDHHVRAARYIYVAAARIDGDVIERALAADVELLGLERLRREQAGSGSHACQCGAEQNASHTDLDGVESSGAGDKGVTGDKRCSRPRIATSSVGTTNSVIGVDSARPPMTASASGFCISLPEPRPSASGKRPKSVQSVVM